MRLDDAQQAQPINPAPLKPSECSATLFPPSRDCQLIASLLSGHLPAPDNHIVASDLLDCFETAAAVLSASPHRLRQIPGLTRDALIAIKTAESLSILHARAALPDQLNPNLNNYDRVIAFCRSRVANKPREELHVLFLNLRNRLIRAETLQTGTLNHTPAYPREICRRAIELDAAAIILLHNHPGGDPTPSRADIDMTTRIAGAAAALGISVHDHIIVTNTDSLSFKAKGFL